MIRKGYKGSNGKPLIQRDFAKLLEYPIYKYAEAGKTVSFGIRLKSKNMEKMIEREKNNRLRDALQDLDDELFGW